MGKKIRVMLSFLLVSLGGFSVKAVEGSSLNCSAPVGDEQTVYRSDFPWGQSLEEITQLSAKIYESGKRLPERAYVENKKIILPLKEEKVLSWGFSFNELKLDLNFVDLLKVHIQKMREKNIGLELIYSDLGHVHIFASNEDSILLEEKGLNPDNADYYESLFKSKKTKFLYHTVEQLREPQNAEEHWRKANKNILGDTEGGLQIVSSSKSIKGYSQLFSLYFNASHKGCFTSKAGKGFDISLSSPD